MADQAWRGLPRSRWFGDSNTWPLYLVGVCAAAFLLSSMRARYRVFRRQWAVLQDVPKDGGGFLISGISKVLAVLRNPMDPAVVMYEAFNGFTQLTSREGIFHFWIGMQPIVVLHAAHTVEPLLTSHANISKTGQYHFLGPVLGEGLLTSKGTKWRSRRKLLTPAFHFRVLDSCVAIFNEQAKVLVSKIRDSAHLDFVDLFPMMTHCTLDVLCESAMGIQLGSQGTTRHGYVKNLHTLLNIGMERLSKPWLWWNPTYNLSSQKRAFARAAKDLNSFVMKVIRTRKQILSQNDKSDQPVHSSGYSKAFLDVLLKHHLEDATLSEEDIIEEVNTFLFAGHETTAVGLTFLLYILGLHPDVQKKVVEEIDLIFDGDFERDVTREDVSCMKYLDCVMKESQRIFTILPIYGRELEEDIHIGKYTVPRGSTCVILGQMLHKDPTYFPNPDVFDPERFLPEKSKGRHPYAFLPFSAGPRNCVGQKFAMTEEKVVVATVLRHYVITSLDHRDQLILAPQPILHPRSVFGGVRVKFTARRRM